MKKSDEFVNSSWNVPFKGFMISLLFSALTNETGYSNSKPMLDQCQCSRLLDESILPWVKFVLFWGHTLPKNQILEIRANLGVVHHMFSRILNLPKFNEIFFVLFFCKVEAFYWDQNRQKMAIYVYAFTVFPPIVSALE